MVAWQDEEAAEPNRRLVEKVKSEVEQYMSKYDGSHDFSHILRVVGNARLLYAEEKDRQPSQPYDWSTIHLAALTHDVGDKKYTPQSEWNSSPIRDMLLRHGSDEATASKVQRIASHVSYSHEVKNPDAVAAVLQSDPELAIVQDSDRLDALGAVGIGRSFMYTGARMPGSSLSVNIEHFPEKLLRLEGMMKTEAGRREAKIRTERMSAFLGWWESEQRAAGVTMEDLA